jgi:hypothetical protein
MPYDRGVDENAAWFRMAPTSLDEPDDLGILEPLLVALIRTVNHRTEGPIGNIMTGRTIMAEEGICACALEALPE